MIAVPTSAVDLRPPGLDAVTEALLSIPLEAYDIELSRRACEDAMRTFVQQAWPVVDPAAFVPNWHIDAICDHVQAAFSGQIQKLAINCPPRNSKSRIVSVLAPAWDWIKTPTRKFLTLSYAAERAIDDAVKSRRLLESYWYRQRGWCDTWRFATDQNVKSYYENTLNGFRFASGFDGGATGQGGDVIIVDDPVKLNDQDNANALQHAVDVYSGVISSRLNDPKTGVIILVMQRLHQKDLTEHVLKEQGWVNLRLPAKFEAEHRCTVVLNGKTFFEDPRTTEGELLNPDRFDQVFMDDFFQKAGSYRSAALQQQRPAPAEGGIIKLAWWKYYLPEGYPRISMAIISVDPNMRATQMSDYVGLQAWGVQGADRYLLRGSKGRWELPELIRQISDLHAWLRKLYPGVGIASLVENTAAGPDVIAKLQRKIPGMLPIKPLGDKVQRVRAVTAAIEAGNVFVPGAANPDGQGYDIANTPLWVQDILVECAGFPTAEHDDQVDAMTQALLWAQDSSDDSLVRILETEEDREREQRARAAHDDGEPLEDEERF